MRLIGYHRFLPLAAVVVAATFGCSASSTTTEKTTTEAEEHDHDAHEHGHEGDHADTYAEAVEKLESLRTAIREGLTGGDKEKADDAVHEVGHLLEHVEELAEKAALSAEDQANVKKDVEELMEHFGAIDEKIHADEEIAYDEFSEKIDAAIERLHALVK